MCKPIEFIIKRIFFDQEPYIWIISENNRKARSFLRKIKRIALKMQASGWDIRPGYIWNENESEFIVNGVVCGVAVFGAGEDPMGCTLIKSGQRPTLVTLDVILFRQKEKNKEQREKFKEWFYSDLKPAVHVKGEIITVSFLKDDEDDFDE